MSLPPARRMELQRALEERLAGLLTTMASPLAAAILDVVAEVLDAATPPARGAEDPRPITERESLADHVWLTTKEAAAYTGRSRATVARHVAAGTLESTSAGRGRGRRYRREWLDEWAEQAPRLPRPGRRS